MPEDVEEDIYEGKGRDELEEAGEISPEEEGFMEGYDKGEKAAKCSMCGKVLLSEFVEKEINGEIYRFCSNRCADNYTKKR